MELTKRILRFIYISVIVFRVPLTTTVTTPLAPTIESTVVSTVTDSSTTDEDKVEMPRVPLTEQVMDHNIRVSDVPDVDPEATDVPDSSLDRNRVIRDVAYFIRAHKFHDYDRRYYKGAEEAKSRLYEEFPKPGLRSLHWEVRKHCEASFIECLKYLERIIRLTTLRREDDTITVMREQKWNEVNNTEQIMAAQRDCQIAQRRDNFTAVPFQGSIGKCIDSS
ncbi:uncharacterized protein LOC120356977 [Solenopsis invicta]|uniref:uncharacterized protein LOC120356977 n=1 Tax=Solenopsis invicta TaxID=13686 RepID=UPI00193C9711|nr:uncharacterized protein LOC120356977 [Solenopsis invicta]